MRAVLTLTLRNVGKKPQLGFCIIKKIYVTSWAKTFLPRDATQSAVMRLHVVCPSVCP